MSAFSIRNRLSSLSLASKIAILCVGLSALLVCTLTGLGYVKAREGLAKQAEATITTDAQAVAGAIDTWHRTRLDAMRVLANEPSLARVLASDAPDPAEVQHAQDALRALDSATDVVDAVGLVNRQGKIIQDSDPKSVGTDIPFRDYFQASMKGQPFITSVTVSVVTNQSVLVHSVPIKGEDGRPLGIIRSRSILSDVLQIVETARGRGGDGAAGLLIDEQGLVIATTIDPSWIGRPIVPLTPDASAALNKGKRWGNAPEPPPLGETEVGSVLGTQQPRLFDWTTGGTTYRGLAVPLATTRWTYITALPVATFEAPATDFLRTAVIAAVLMLALLFLIVVLFARTISRAVGQITTAARGLAAGDVEQRVELTGRDELGQMADAFRAMIAYQRQAAAVATAVAAGDLTRSMTPASERDTLGRALRDMIGGLRSIVGEVQDSTDLVAEAGRNLSLVSAHSGDAVQQVAVAIQHLARDAEGTAASATMVDEAVGQLNRAIEHVATGAQSQAEATADATATVREMTDRIDQMATDAQTVAAAGAEARSSAEASAEAVRETVAGMTEIVEVVGQASARVQELGKLGEKIGAVVETIDDIADQTNLLALNAAIEAARAGEHGRGFAIVADEVRKLAERSQRETKAIATLIRDVQQGTREAVEAMSTGTDRVAQGAARADEAGRSLSGIMATINLTVEHVAGIAASAGEASAYARNVADLMQTISAVVEENTAATEQMSAHSNGVGQLVESIAASTSQATSIAEEVSAATEEMSAQVEELHANAANLSNTADELRQSVSRFVLEDESASAHPDSISERPSADARQIAGYTAAGRGRRRAAVG